MSLCNVCVICHVTQAMWSIELVFVINKIHDMTCISEKKKVGKERAKVTKSKRYRELLKPQPIFDNKIK